MAAKPWKEIKPVPAPTDDVLIGTVSKDRLSGGDGDDFLDGRGNDDRLLGGGGQDTLNGGAGSDRVFGEAGDDILFYVAAENRGDSDDYDGGTERDTLVLELTRAEWMSPAFQSDLQRYLAYLASGATTDFRFTAFDLRASGFETLEILVDGVSLNPADAVVAVAADGMAAGEHTPSLAVDVLANDLAEDLVRSISFTQAGGGSIELVETRLTDPVGAPGARFVYTPKPGAWDHLAAGQTATDTFTYTVTDADGDSATATVTVTVTGANDGPVILAPGSDTAGAVVETTSTGLLTDAGSVAFRDLDLIDTHSVSVGAPLVALGGGAPVGLVPDGGWGVLSAIVVEDPADGDDTGRIEWRFTADDAAVQRLGAGQTVTQTYAVTLADRSGASAVQQVAITITGTNDGPTVAGESVAGAFENAPFMISAASLLANDADPDAGDTLSVVSVSGARNGTVALNDAGEVVFTPDADFNGVATFDYVVSDSHGATAAATASLAVAAVVAAPTLAVAAAAGDEDTAIGLSIDAALIGSDPGEALSIVISGVPAGALLSAGQLGENGSWRLTPGDLAGLTVRPAPDADSGFTLTVTAVASEDGKTASTTAQLPVALRPINDAPVIVASRTTATGSVTELANRAPGENTATHTRTGQIAFSDPDATDLHTAVVTAQGAGYIGGLTLGPIDPVTQAATWTFSAPDSALDSLAAGETLTQTYTVSVSDRHGGAAEQTVTVTLHGAADEVPLPPVGPSGLTYVDMGGDRFQSAVNLVDPNDDGLLEPQGATGGRAGANISTFIRSADLDRDGDYEYVFIWTLPQFPYYRWLSVGTNVEDGVFSEYPRHVIAYEPPHLFSSNLNFQDVGFMDVDGNGFLDIIVASHDTVVEFRNQGPSGEFFINFQMHVAVGNLNSNPPSGGISIGDVNGDGREDIIVPSWGGANTAPPLVIWYNGGDAFQGATYRKQIVDVPLEYHYSSAVGDFNNDGRLDFVLVGSTQKTVYLNGGDPDGDGLVQFQAVELDRTEALVGWVTEIKAADIDRDGDLDILYGLRSGELRIAYNLGDANKDGVPEFALHDTLDELGVIGGHHWLALGDVDGDGDLDVLQSSFPGGARMLFNQGDTDGDGRVEFTSVYVAGDWADVEFLGESHPLARASSGASGAPVGDFLLV